MADQSPRRSGTGTALTAQTLVTAWEQFLSDYYKSEIEEVALSYPERKSVIVDWPHIDLRDPSLAQYLLEHPVAALKAAEDAVRSIEVPVEPRPKLHVRVRNLPKVHHFLVRKLRAEHLGRFVAIEGMVKKVVEVRPKLEDAIFRCEMCGAVFKIKQEDQLLREPDVCPEEQGGCGRKGVFKLLTEESKFIDHQKIEMQESHEDLRGGAQPERIAVYLEDDIVGNVAPGDRIVINGILRAQQRRQGSLKYAEFLKVIDCVSIEVQQHEFEEIEITPEDIAQIQLTAQTPNLYDHLRGAFAPEMYGLDEIKDCLLLALFGGEAKEYADGTRLRGDMHVLLVGDPGTGKSQLLRYISKLAPRAVYTSGKGSSASGLTAAAVRDEFGEGQWVLEAGALVLADRGVALVDELDKMDPHDQSAMHQAMEQQEISIAKAGITATLKSRCAVIGGANPKLGRFDEFTNILAQINMPPPLLSRFDLIFSLRDKPQRETDAQLARHVLATHRAGEVMEYRRIDPEGPYSEEFAQSLIRHIHPTIPSKLLRKYIAYAKRYIHPVMTEEALGSIEQYYVDLRSSSSTIPFTARALESIVRLTEAAARARLSQTATNQDAEHAIKLYTHALRGVGWNEETGSLDIDIIAAGASQSQQDRMRRILQVIRENTNAAEDRYPDTQTVVREAVAQGIPEAKVKEALDILKERGSVYSPRHDRWAAV
jgi:replicative DNA helicase Mcm